MKNMFNRLIIVVVIFTILNFSTPALLNNEIDNYSKTESSVSKIYKKLDRDIIWDVQLNFTEPGGEYDYTVFGEAPDANDGPPHDDYDAPKPPAPIEPYVQAWFYDNMEPPYNKMFDDYRTYPDTNKLWNLTVMWADGYLLQDTIVTIS